MPKELQANISTSAVIDGINDLTTGPLDTHIILYQQIIDAAITPLQGSPHFMTTTTPQQQQAFESECRKWEMITAKITQHLLLASIDAIKLIDGRPTPEVFSLFNALMGEIVADAEAIGVLKAFSEDSYAKRRHELHTLTTEAAATNVTLN